MSPVSRGFRGRGRIPAEEEDRVPPGQYVTKDFPVLSGLAHATYTAARVDILDHPGQRHAQILDLAGDAGAAGLRPSLPTSTASPAGPRSAPSGGACRWTRCWTRWQATPPTCWRSASAATPPTCHRGRHRRQGVGGLRATTARRSNPSTAARPGCSCRTCTSGRAPSGCAAWNCAITTRPGLGDLRLHGRTARGVHVHGDAGPGARVDGHAGPGVDVDGHAGRLTARRFAYQTDMARRGIHGLGSQT